MSEPDDARPDPDPKGLIREAYCISGIGTPECRTIFLDWALSLPDGLEPSTALRVLLGRYATSAPRHPMTELLIAGLEGSPVRRRRGGPAGRQGLRNAR